MRVKHTDRVRGAHDRQGGKDPDPTRRGPPAPSRRGYGRVLTHARRLLATAVFSIILADSSLRPCCHSRRRLLLRGATQPCPAPPAYHLFRLPRCPNSAPPPVKMLHGGAVTPASHLFSVAAVPKFSPTCAPSGSCCEHAPCRVPVKMLNGGAVTPFSHLFGLRRCAEPPRRRRDAQPCPASHLFRLPRCPEPKRCPTLPRSAGVSYLWVAVLPRTSPSLCTSGTRAAWATRPMTW